MMEPINDPRPFAAVLRDWMDRHGLVNRTAGRAFGWSPATTTRRLAGTDEPPDGLMARALMTLADEGRAPPIVAIRRGL